MTDIKKADAGPALRADSPGRVSQACLFETEEGGGDCAASSTATAVAGNAGKRTAVYARVSSEQQEKEETIASQMEAIAQYAKEGGIVYDDASDAFLDEGYSGTVLRRPGLDKLLDRVHEGCYDQVLVFDPDRLARNYGHQIMLIEEFQGNGCEPVFIRRPIGQGAEEDLLLQMQGVIAQYEHAKIKERTRRGRLHKMRNGELVNGQRTFGYRYVKADGGTPAHYEIIPEEAEVIRDMFRWYTEDGLSMCRIATRLQEEGVPTIRGGRWSGSHIGHMLGNSIYMGTGYANKIEAVEPEREKGTKQYRRNLKSSRRRRPPEEWHSFSTPQIVTEETFELAQARLKENKRLSPRRTERPYLLRGLMNCELCDMHIFCDTQSYCYICAFSRRAYARNHGRSPCENKRRLPVPQLDELVWREVKNLLKKPALLKKQYPELRDKIHPRAAGSLEVIDSKLAEVEKQMKRTNDLFISGFLEQDEHAEKHSDLDSRKKQLAAQRDKVSSEHLEHQEIEQLMASFTAFAKTIKSRLDTADFDTRRSIVEQLVKRVSVGKKVITIEYIAPLKKNNLCRNLQAHPLEFTL